jgi:hypothetical protein
MADQFTAYGRPRPWLGLARALVLVASSGYAAAACAADSNWSMFSFSAFGTLGAVHSSDTDADFTSSYLKPNGAGYTHAWSTAVDSLLGGQALVRITPQLSAVLQVISEQLYDNTYRPHVEWANLKYQFTPEFNLRLGRTVLPSFMLSDTRKVGYSNPWVRPPVEVYDLVPITNSDGVDASYDLHLGEVVHRLRASYGKNDPRLTPPPGGPGGTAQGRNMWLVSDTIEYGAASAHVAYQNVHLTVPGLNAIFDGLRYFGPQGVALADRYDEVDKVARFIGVGAQYDPERWFIMGEWGTIDRHSVFGESTAWYVSSGYRWAQLTPYLTYSAVKADSNTSDPGLTLSNLPPYLAGPAAELNTSLNDILGAIAIQRTISLGVRWDALRNMDLKLQCDHTRLGAGSQGTLINVQPDFRRGGTENLISATVDFVL